MTLVLVNGGTVIDGVAERPFENGSILIEQGRIKAIGRRDDFPAHLDATLVDAKGKFVIPGLMDANVHLLEDMRLRSAGPLRGAIRGPDRRSGTSRAQKRTHHRVRHRRSSAGH